MQLTVKVVGERAKHTTYSYSSRPETEAYTVADVTIDGSGEFIAASLRALAASIDPTTAKSSVEYYMTNGGEAR